jgi:hypothetical protein
MYSVNKVAKLKLIEDQLYSYPIWIVRKDSTGILSHKALTLTNDLGLLYVGESTIQI